MIRYVDLDVYCGDVRNLRSERSMEGKGKESCSSDAGAENYFYALDTEWRGERPLSLLSVLSALSLSFLEQNRKHEKECYCHD